MVSFLDAIFLSQSVSLICKAVASIQTKILSVRYLVFRDMVTFAGEDLDQLAIRVRQGFCPGINEDIIPIIS